ncbi:5-hydroxyisourate hydrolase [Nocardioides sp. BE266]|uniref:hydroxyisourate hydrolase n=1 Tax=Nocardioides sp. BE266 TaxID=2817725 RepID=UPI00285B9B57|nr:hydroxyisourate hydrolase [Nocardioides sp. BE266]MDR7251666.1 5-hydroxyisourate hydrolase [Nocardioides sp. BE266]
MASLSTHVLDTSTGRPAAGVGITLESADGSVLAEGVTDADGRIGELAADLVAEDHVLRFDTGSWFAAQGTTAFYPEVVVTFAVGGDEHYHVPLLLNPFGYSTYRGS